MDWVILSLLSAIAFTTFTIIQKRTLDRYVASSVTFYGIAASLQVSIAVVILALSPPSWLSAGVGVMVIVGLLGSAVQLLQGFAIKRETDISRIVPVLDSFPLFTIIIAIVFLGEVLTPLKWAAVVTVISGAVLASWHQAIPGERIKLNQSLVAVIGAAMAMAVMTVLVKVASADVSLLQMMALMWLFAGPGYIVAALVGRAGDDIRATLRSLPAMRHIGATQVAMMIAMIAGLAAIAIGPVSLTTAIMGTRPVLLLLWFMVSGFGFRDAMQLRRRGVPKNRLASAGLVTAGVGVMAF